MENGKDKRDTAIANSLVAKIQLGLPGTVTKLSSKMRFIDHMAPKLRGSGVIRTLEKKSPLTIRVSGIATASKTIPAFGGILYSAGAVRQDLYIEEGSVYQTFQDSLVDIDEADDIDVSKKLKFIHISQVYDLLEEIVREATPPQIVIVDTPLLLERADAPLESHEQLLKEYQQCKERIEQFWSMYQDNMYPFNSNGIQLVSLSTKRFGSVFYGLTAADREKYIIDAVHFSELQDIEDSFNKIKKVGVKKMLHGILTRRTRTAAYQYDILTSENRLEPANVRELGLINFHLRAGMRTIPLLVEVIGSYKDWDSGAIDQLASYIISLFTVDQPRALPLPLWYAEYALKPIRSGTIIQYFKTQAREMIKREEVENVWTEEADFFGEDEI
jgi:hypothetical protein